MDKYKFGEFIYNKRKKLGLTQDELGRMLGVTNKAVSKWETGETLPDIQLLEMLAGALNVTIDELLTQIPPKENVKSKPKIGWILFQGIVWSVLIMIIVLMAGILCIKSIPNKEIITTDNALEYYSISPCISAKVNNCDLTINGAVSKNKNLEEAYLKLNLNIQYFYITNDNKNCEILYIDRVVEVDESSMDFTLTLTPKNELADFKSFYGFNVTYEIIEVRGKVI